MTKTSDSYFHRDLDWLLFNRRVMKKAGDKDYPLLERLRFLAIGASNLDEFFEVRVSELQANAKIKPNKQQEGTSYSHEGIMEELTKRNQKNLDWQYKHYKKLNKKLAAKAASVKSYVDLTEAEKTAVNRLYQENIVPFLTPIRLEKQNFKPRIKAKTIHIFVKFVNKAKDKKKCQVVIPLPEGISRLLRLPDSEAFVLLEDVIIHQFDSFFPDCKIKHCFLFRITYDENISFDEDPNGNMDDEMARYLRERSLGLPTRVEVNLLGAEKDIFHKEFQPLEKEFQLKKRAFYYFDEPLDLTFLNDFISESGHAHPELLFPALEANTPDELSEANILATLDSKDVLLQHPYDSYDAVLHFLQAAAKDPAVVTIKQTLYRVAPDSKIVEALLLAHQLGKDVSVVVELKARFDEANNLKWLDKMKEAGIAVYYGDPKLKIHSKVILVVKNDGKTYVHLATGNYNEKSARIYSDLSLLSSQSAYGQDVTKFFHCLETSDTSLQSYQTLAVSPVGIKQMILAKIDEVIAYHKDSGKGRLFFKVNGITDKVLIQKLYAASQAGVPVKLVVRGESVLRPGAKKLSENIEIRSVVGRFLEHSRLYAFETEQTEVWLASADLMTRNMDNRVELATRLIADNTVAAGQKIITALSSLNHKVFFLDSHEHNDYCEAADTLNPQDYFINEM